MKSCTAPAPQTTRRLLPIVYAVALAMACTISLSHPVAAGDITPPPVPGNLKVPAGPPRNKVFLQGDAIGTQDYICLPCPNPITPDAAMCPASFAWTLFGPQATLFDDNSGRQIITHFLSPNPDENGTPRPTWQNSKDSSTIWAMQVFGASSTDPDFVAPGAIPWLLLQVVGRESGPTDGDKLTETTYIQRLSTSGGVAPATGCSQAADVGKRALVSYMATYFFYKPTPNGR